MQRCGLGGEAEIWTEMGLDSKWVILTQEDFCPANETNP